MTDLKDKCIVVTGSSRGIGAGIAKLLAAKGARVALTYSSGREACEKVMGSLEGQGHMLLQMNVSESASVEQGFGEILKKFEKIDGLVNNAGITKDGLLLRMKEDDFDSVIGTNLRGVYLCTKAAMKSMLRVRRGSVVNVSSVIAQMGNTGQANYGASKAGIEGFTRSVAQEVASRGLRINAVAPGFITTDMTDSLDPKQKESIEAKIPMQTLGTVDDVANAVAFFLSDISHYITGQVLQVNGGLYM